MLPPFVATKMSGWARSHTAASTRFRRVEAAETNNTNLVTWFFWAARRQGNNQSAANITAVVSFARITDEALALAELLVVKAIIG